MVEQHKTFRDLIAENKEKSVLLIISFGVFFAVVIFGLSLGFVAYVPLDDLKYDNKPRPRGQYQQVYAAKPREINFADALAVAGLAGSTALALAFLGYFNGDDMILAVHGAREVKHELDPELYNVVQEMAIAAGVPPPKIYMISDSSPNAFATGRDPEHASIAITSGLRYSLSRDQLQAVIAHEMAHVRNYDIRLMLLMAVLVGAIVMLCDLFWQILRYGPSGSGNGSGGGSAKGGAGPWTVILIIVAVVLAIIAPILAQIIQLAVSREREYLADATAVELTRHPQALADALKIISEDPKPLKSANRGTAHLYIVNPVEKYVARANSVFASHPPIEERIRRLEALVHKYPTPERPG